ncbi:uncharacterized protein LOC143448428 [Clavelina lepadiformis]|uniref:Uncharacterized protein n=1 Tax=Clavelina lepadiformis TaxID=159417 RepID=A0ABP0H3P5_CLALP
MVSLVQLFQYVSIACGSLALCTGVTSIAVNTWLYAKGLNTIRLFVGCFGSGCEDFTDTSSDLTTVEIFLITALILVFIGNLAMIRFRLNPGKNAGLIAAYFQLIGGICAVLAISVLTDMTKAPADHYGSSFILAWITGGLALVASISGFISVKLI